MRRTTLGVTAAAAVGLILLAPPGLTWLDAGELGAASAELGIAHPPGFPLFALVHKLVLLLPLGDVAFRGNLASALLAAAAVGAVAWAARAWGAQHGAWAGALLVGLAPLYALHGTTIEVYSGAALWLGLALGLARQDDPRARVALAFWIGLAAGHHAELRLFALVLLPLALWGSRRRALLGLAAAVFGGLVVLYLPLRAGADPWRNWGDPSTFGALWDHLMGFRIRAAYAGQFGALRGADAVEFARQIWQTAPGLSLLGLAGIAALGRRGWLLWACLLIDLGYAAGLNPMGLRDAQNGVPTLIILGIGAGYALCVVVMQVQRRAPGLAPAAPWLPALALACAIPQAPRLFDHQRDRGLPLLTGALGDAVAPDALAFVVSDDMAAGLAFAQVVEGLRPDVGVVVRQHAWDPSSIEPVRARQPALMAGWKPGARVADFVHLNDGWPVAWEWGADDDVEARPADLRSAYPLPARGATTGPFLPQLARAAELSPTRFSRGRIARFADERARHALSRGRNSVAVQSLEVAVALGPDRAQPWINLGAARAATGDFRAAAVATEAGLQRAPDNATAWVNLIRFRFNGGDVPAASAAIEALLVREPNQPDALGLRGIIKANAGDLAGARVDLEAALRGDPNQAEARAALPRLPR